MSLCLFAICATILLAGIIILLSKFHESYFKYLNTFLHDRPTRPKTEKIRLLFRAYLLLGCILAGSLTFVEAGFDVSSIETSFSSFFLSSCFLLFIARTYTTTKIISATTNSNNIMHYINHINFLAFFGMITGMLKILLVLNQDPKLLADWIETIATYTIEVGVSTTLMPCATFVILTFVLIPFVFSLFEFVLIAYRDYSEKRTIRSK